MSDPLVLDLSLLASGIDRLTPARGAALEEAAAVCLTGCGHTSGVVLLGDEPEGRVVWHALHEFAAASNADPQVATEDGAVAIAILWARERHGLRVVRRARKGPGFDWHLSEAPLGEPFDASHALEVSGILREDERLLSARMSEKIRRFHRAGSGLPGFAVVVGFTGPTLRAGVL